MKEVCALTGFSRTHIYRLERAGKFVRRRKVGLSKIGFPEDEYEDWARSRPMPDLPSDLDE
jgi:predicted DNA-binding transcriptional regulator AlpA